MSLADFSRSRMFRNMAELLFATRPLYVVVDHPHHNHNNYHRHKEIRLANPTIVTPEAKKRNQQ